MMAVYSTVMVPYEAGDCAKIDEQKDRETFYSCGSLCGEHQPKEIAIAIALDRCEACVESERAK